MSSPGTIRWGPLAWVLRAQLGTDCQQCPPLRAHNQAYLNSPTSTEDARKIAGLFPYWKRVYLRSGGWGELWAVSVENPVIRNAKTLRERFYARLSLDRPIAAVFLKMGGVSLAGFGSLLAAFLHSCPDHLKQIPIKSSTQRI